MSIRPPPLDGTNRRKSAREQPWADPALYAFLRERLRPLSVKQKDDLATRWRQTLNETCAKERIDNLVRGTLPMTAREAANFLTVTNLEAEWTKRTQSSDFLITPVSGQFDYRAQGEGDIREMDIAAVARAGISMDNIAGQLMAIDTALFAHMGSETWMGVANDWRDIAVAYPDTWRIWVNERNEVLAYWMFVNPTPDIFRKGVCGEYPEAEITLPTLRPLEAGPVHIYGPGMYVRQNVGRSLKHILATLLITSFFYQLRRLEHLGREFAEICIPVCSSEGLGWAKGRFQLERMPIDICRRYAARTGWKFVHDGTLVLPAIHYGLIGEDLRRAVGLPVGASPAQAELLAAAE